MYVLNYNLHQYLFSSTNILEVLRFIHIHTFNFKHLQLAILMNGVKSLEESFCYICLLSLVVKQPFMKQLLILLKINTSLEFVCFELLIMCKILRGC